MLEYDRKNYLSIIFLNFNYCCRENGDLMSKKFSKEPLRGMDDYYPDDLREVYWIIEMIRDVVEKYGYEEYLTPQIEPIEIFAAKS